ncbi:Gfo/Idh/MocA family protein [Clostridium omnivorum]|uniref:Dehydrogenase n=1 Tax=Clostridium omnivorum TaxID=1604902 RepID=A0ABQ5N8N2_9CLOT|nr:Gfo/Idh/MocA family oxidoreductase [Clostridium sp. E14]GLC31571.1 dehydrogenase [Clostridium sp. E14]
MRKYRLGIIGTGMRTMFFINELLKHGRFEIKAISDIHQENMDLLCSRYEAEWDKYKDYKMLLKREDIDAVVIMSPDYVHEEQAIAAFEAGKHVFLEKPIATTIEGGKRVIEKRDESGKTLTIGFVLRYNKLYKKMYEIVNSGALGELKTGWVLHSVGAGSDWYFHDWHSTFENTSGLLLQKGSHDFDIINWIVNSNAKRLMAFGSQDYFGGDKANELVCENCEEKYNCPEATRERIVNWERYDGKKTEVLYNIWRNQCAFRKEIDVLDNHQVILEYTNGAKVSYMECHYTPDDNREYIFIGTKGKLKLDDAKDTITVQLRHSMYDRIETITYTNLQSSEGHGGGDKYIIQDFVDALDTGKQPIAGGEAGLEAILLGLKAHEAIRTGEIQEL